MLSPGRACLFDGPQRPLRLITAPAPQLQRKEVLVRVSCCTLCGSDLHTVCGNRAEPAPSVLGHEILGTVEALGPDLAEPLLDVRGTPVRLGDRVTWAIAASCGTCFYCCHGLPQKCESLFKYGHRSVAEDRPWSGGLAEYCVLVPCTSMVKVSDDLSDVVACPANCATATVAAALRLAGDVHGKTVLVQGAGMLGLTACAMLHAQGAGNIIAWDRDRQRLEQAQWFGATCIASADDSGALGGVVRAATDGRGVDLALELTGATAAAQEGMKHLRIGGDYILVGAVLPGEPLQLDLQQVVRRMLTVRGLHNYAPQDLVAAIDFLQNYHQHYPFADMVSAQFSLEQVEAAFSFAMRQRPLRVAVTFQSS